MILPFCGYHAESELLASERCFWAIIRRAVWPEANLNVKREMSESFGKPLTAFETFKARFEKLLKKLFPTETRKVDGSDLSVPNFLVLIRWSAFFWGYNKTDTFDEAVMMLWVLSSEPAEIVILWR